ncbi:MAG: hypothetical protein MMC23_000477 [Stictis urceolatum]|nr:hypothetical protein [Stictis urceolata]
MNPTPPEPSKPSAPENSCPFPPLPEPPSNSSHSPGQMRPTTGSLPSTQITMGGGVAIFHLATARVVLCYHTRDKYWFLPKGRRDVDEDSRSGAEREGFEESGFRARVLSLPIPHRQPAPSAPLAAPTPTSTSTATTTATTTDTPHTWHHPAGAAPQSRFNTEPVRTDFQPVGRGSATQYILHWFIAETVPPAVERECDAESTSRLARGESGYVRPRRMEAGMTLRERVREDSVQEEGGDGESRESRESGERKKGSWYEPVRHEGTAVDSEEAFYTSELVPVEEALGKLTWAGMDGVARAGWEGILRRWEIEEGWEDVEGGRGKALSEM